jgi:DNA polymerase III delta prime subunit
MWAIKYRPKTIKDVIFQDDNQKKKFNNFVAAGDIPNLFLSGIRGTGKSSIAGALVKDLGVHPADVKKINCSKDKVDAMRDLVDNFIWTIPLGKFKVARLEEFDYMSAEGQALLRTPLEDASKNCRFIITCNYENRVLPEVKDRFQRFYFKSPSKEEIAVRMTEILEAEKIDFDVEHLLTYIDVGYPSIRQITQLLQQNSVNGVLESPTTTSVIETDWRFGLLDYIAGGDFKSARKLVCDSTTREEHEEIFTFLYKNIDKLKVKNKDAAVVTIAQYARSHALVADTEINLAAMFIELGNT